MVNENTNMFQREEYNPSLTSEVQSFHPRALSGKTNDYPGIEFTLDEKQQSIVQEFRANRIKELDIRKIYTQKEIISKIFKTYSNPPGDSKYERRILYSALDNITIEMGSGTKYFLHDRIQEVIDCEYKGEETKLPDGSEKDQLWTNLIYNEINPKEKSLSKYFSEQNFVQERATTTETVEPKTVETTTPAPNQKSANTQNTPSAVPTTETVETTPPSLSERVMGTVKSTVTDLARRIKPKKIATGLSLIFPLTSLTCFNGSGDTADTSITDSGTDTATIETELQTNYPLPDTDATEPEPKPKPLERHDVEIKNLGLISNQPLFKGLTSKEQRIASVEYLDLAHPFTPETPNFRETSPYGERKNPFSQGELKIHHGIDLSAKIGTPIQAPCNGTATYRGKIGTAGKVLTVVCDNNLVSMDFFHLSNVDQSIRNWGEDLNNLSIQPLKNYPRKAISIEKGQTVAYTGNTGNVTGPHLHAEVYLNLDLINFLNKLGPNQIESTCDKEKTFKDENIPSLCRVNPNIIFPTLNELMLKPNLGPKILEDLLVIDY